MKNKICVYTCITGSYDNLKEISNIEEGIDYYCFTNNKKIKSNTWNVIYIEDKELSNVLLARKTKILGNDIVNNYDIALWMDGAVVFKKPIKEFIKTYLGKNDSFGAFKHGERNNIKDEAYTCVKCKKETRENVKSILDFYKKEKFLDNYGLIESTVFIKRPKDNLIKKTMDLWFDMVKNYSKRDQLSFNYCISKTGLNVRWIDEKVFDNEWFNWKSHKLNNEIKSFRLYFGNENEKYDLNLDIQNDWIKENNTYFLKVISPVTTNSITLQITDVSLINFDNIKINNFKEKDYVIYNYIEINKKKYFYNANSIIKINKQIKKNEILNIKLDMKILNQQEKDNLINDLSVENIIIKKENKDLKTINKENDKNIKELNNIRLKYEKTFNYKVKKLIKTLLGK